MSEAVFPHFRALTHMMPGIRQVVPTVLSELLQDTDLARCHRVSQAMLQKKKLEIGALQRAYDGK